MTPERHSGERLRRQYSFGDFTFDVENRVLQRGGEEVTLRPKSLEVLAHLVDHSGQLVTKASLIEAVWPDTAVTDNSLAQCMVEIRRALDDDSQQLIRTVARRGYIFAAPVTTVAEFARPAEELRPLPVAPAAPDRNTGRLAARWYLLGAGALVLLALAISGFLLTRPAKREPERAFTQITNFTDSAVPPALSPDGRMLAFIRSGNWWLTTGQIWVKLLPNGEPVQVTHDPRQKYGLSFSPDGSRIAYTTQELNVWKTSTVSPLPSESASIQCRRPHLARRTPALVLGNKDRRPHGGCHGNGKPFGIPPDLFSPG